MKTSFTAVIEQANSYSSNFETEPYETAWADEARWFVRLLELDGERSEIVLHPQISPDGLNWCDEGTPPLRFSEPGLASFPLRDFGHWLRLRAELSGQGVTAKVLIYLALKG
jgi:hypothetical protein